MTDCVYSQNTIYEQRVYRQIFRGQGFGKYTAANTNNPIAIYTGVGGPRSLMWFAAAVDPRPVIRVDGGERFLRERPHKNSTSKKPIAPVGRLPVADSASTTAPAAAAAYADT